MSDVEKPVRTGKATAIIALVIAILHFLFVSVPFLLYALVYMQDFAPKETAAYTEPMSEITQAGLTLLTFGAIPFTFITVITLSIVALLWHNKASTTLAVIALLVLGAGIMLDIIAGFTAYGLFF